MWLHSLKGESITMSLCSDQIATWWVLVYEVRPNPRLDLRLVRERI